MRQSLMRQQQEIAALQDFIDKHKMRQQDSKHVDGFLEVCQCFRHAHTHLHLHMCALFANIRTHCSHTATRIQDVVQKSLLDAQAAEERERRRTKVRVIIVAIIHGL
jgi:hypothetical protein